MMTPKTFLPCLATAVLLSACASSGGPADKIHGPSLNIVMAEADAAAKSGQPDKALAILKAAASSYPTEKGPWLHMAKMKFDRANYGEAILHAQEALQRDPLDKVANGIVAVSGLKLSTKALADLARQNEVSISVRLEAHDLAKLIHNSLGEDVPSPVSTGGSKKSIALKKMLQSQQKSAVRTKNAADTFGALK